jgi:soluble lytic murein transglycosylase-like protein
LFQFFKVFSLAVALGLSLIPGHHQPAPSSRTVHLDPSLLSERPELRSLKLDGQSSERWTAVQAALQAEIDAEKAREAAAAAAAAAAARPSPPRPAPAPNPGVAAVQNLIRQAFAPMGQTAVDWGLRVAACESGYNPNAYNPDGASGVFQFMPSTFRATPYGNQNIFDATANVDAAAWYYGQHGGGAWSCK